MNRRGVTGPQTTLGRDSDQIGADIGIGRVAVDGECA